MTTIYASEPEFNIENHAAQIRASGILARGTHLRSLFEYLYRCYVQNRIPKEHEIAIEGIGQEKDIGLAQDAVVGVYVNKLQRKLDEFYEQYGKDMPNRLKIPTGEYRLILETRNKQTTHMAFSEYNEQPESGRAPNARNINIVLLCAVIILLNIIFLLLTRDQQAGINSNSCANPALETGPE